MRDFAKLAAAGVLSLAVLGGTAFAATAPVSQPAKTAMAKKVHEKKAAHAAKKAEKKAD